MKKVFARCLMFATLMLLFVGFATSAYAWSRPPGHRPPGGPPASVPEPITLALVGAGIVGVGAYLYIKRKKRK